MADLEKPVLTGEALNPSIEWVLNLVMELVSHNGGNLSAAVTDVLNVVKCLNEAIVTNQDLQQVAYETNERYQAVCARLVAS